MKFNHSLVNNTSTNKSTLKPYKAEMLRFVKLLHGSNATWFLKFRKNSEPFDAGAQHYGTPARFLGKLMDANMDGYNIAVAVNQIGAGSRKNDNVTTINAVFIDVDNGMTTYADLMDLPLPPNLIVETSPSRLHAYWLVSNCSVQKFKRIQHALAQRFDSDVQVCDPARMMRFPGSINWNHGSPVLAQIVDEVERAPVLVAKLVRALGLKMEAPAKSAPNGQPLATSQKEGDASQKPLTDAMQSKIRKALANLPADDRSIWLHVGMAIHSIAATTQGYGLWTTWSKGGAKFDKVVQLRTWKHFKAKGGINIHTLFWLSRRAGATSGFDDMDAAQLFATTRDLQNSKLPRPRNASVLKLWALYRYLQGHWALAHRFPLGWPAMHPRKALRTGFELGFVLSVAVLTHNSNLVN